MAPAPQARLPGEAHPGTASRPGARNRRPVGDRHRRPAPRAYARTAVKGELARVREARSGTCNENLYIAAASLGQPVRAGFLLDADWVADALRNAGLDANASGNPEPAREIEAIIRSGLAKGLRELRRPPRPGRTAA
jgi:hypothetical protein